MSGVPAFLSLVAAAFIVLANLPAATALAEEKPVVVFAAMSTKTALDDIRASWQARTGRKLTVSYGSAAALARQIEQGAPADIFISADLDWMRYLSERKLTVPNSERPLLGNKLVLVAHRDWTTPVQLVPGVDLAGLLGNGRLALCDSSVPVGKYAKASLEVLGAWRSVQSKLALAPDVRAAAVLVARGEAPLGIVYATDVAADPRLKIVSVFPSDSHPPIVYPIASLAGSTNPNASTFMEFLGSADAQPFFERQGFTLLRAAHLPQ